MGLEDNFGKVPLRRIFRRFFEALFDPETGHDHDGVNSKTLSPAAVVENGSVTTVKIVDEAVTADKIAANAVTTEKIEDGAVTAGKLAADAVVEENIADDAVTTDKIEDEAVTAAKLNADVAGNGVGLNTGTNAIEVKVDDATLEISDDMLQVKASGVDTTQLADDAVTNDKLANITRGSVKVGGANDAPTDLDASGDGTILIGDGTDLKSVAVTGDVTITNAGVTAIGAGKVTSAMLASDANLAAVIAAGFGATQTVAQDAGSTVELLVADPTEDRACLVMVLVKVSLAGDAAFSIQDADGTEMLAVPPDTAAGTVLTGAGVLAATKALNIVPTAGGAGEIQAFVLSLPAA